MEAVEEGSRQALDGEGQAPIDQATPTKEVNCQSDEAFALQAEAQSPEEPSENTSGGGLGTSQSPSYSDDPHLAEAVKKMAQLSTAKPQKFSLNDFLAANSPELAKRAFQELGGGSGRGTPRRGGKGAADLGQHEVDLAQQRMALEELAAQCAEESAAHKEMSGLIIARLDEGRRSIENLNTMLRALGAAAAAHATAMRAAAKVKLHAQSAEQSSMPGLPAIQRQLNQLPAVVSEASTALAASLGASAGELQSLLADYRAAAKSLTAAATATHAATAKACAQLLASFKQHEAACVAFDAVFRERGRGRAVRSPELDPWATELKLNDERRALAAARDAERTYVARGLGDVQSLEGLRVNLEHNVMVGVAEAHQAAMMPFGGELASLQQKLSAVDLHFELADLRRAAAATITSAAQQRLEPVEADGLSNAEIFCSPEIQRQGAIKVWDAWKSTWTDVHAVLTRAGFLHWFASPEDKAPLEGLALGRAQFEQGEAPVFNLTEGGSRWLSGIKGKKHTFQAASWEEYCEWAIAIREAITEASALISSGLRPPSTGGSGASAATTRTGTPPPTARVSAA